MQSSQLEVLQAALAGIKNGLQVTLVSVVKTFGTSPRPVGSLLAVSSDGSFTGSVSGGCVEEDLLRRLVEKTPQQCELIRYGESERERHHFGLPCGGTLDLMLEPLAGKLVEIQQLVDALQARRTLTRRVSLDTSEAEVVDWQAAHQPQLIGEVWQNIFGPVWRLLIIGGGETSRYLAELGNALGYRILVCDPRPEYREGWTLDSVIWHTEYPDDVVRGIHVDERTAIVALTHDPKLDDLALMEGLRSPAFYVGALGSFNTNRNRRQRMREHFDFSEQELMRLKGPVGLPIGSKTPPEIALAVMAELTALRNGIDIRAQLDRASA